MQNFGGLVAPTASRLDTIFGIRSFPAFTLMQVQLYSRVKSAGWGSSMRTATWNINGLRARSDFLVHWLRTRQPDIVGLQELKLTDESFPYAELKALGYHAVIHAQKAWNGVAILSREPAQVHQQGLPGEEEL